MPGSSHAKVAAMIGQQLLTSVSKKLGKTAVVIHYCGLLSQFEKRRGQIATATATKETII